MKVQSCSIVAAILAAGLCTQVRAADEVWARAWEDLATTDETKVDNAAAVLRAGGEPAAQFLLGKLLSGADREKVSQLLIKLDDPNFKTREAARDDLLALGKSIEPFLPQFPPDTGNELAARVALLRKALQKVAAPPTSDAVRQELAVEIIASRGPDAADMLRKIEAESVWQSTRIKAVAALSELDSRKAETLFDLADAAAKRGEPAKAELDAALDFVGRKNLFGDDTMAYRSKRCTAIVRAMTQIAALQKAIADNPADAKSRNDLIQLKVSLGDVVACAALVKADTPADLTEGIALLAKDKELTKDQRLALSAWCRSQAAKAGPGGERELLLLARAEIAQCVTEQDKTPAAAALREQIASINDLLAHGGSDWTNVLALADTNRHVIRGDWSRMGGMLRVAPSDFALVSLPLVPNGSYEMEVSLKRISGAEGIFISIPVGDRRANINVGGWANTVSGFEQIGGVDAAGQEDEKIARKDGIVNGEVYVYLVRVKLEKNRQAAVTITENGKPFTSWRGDISKLGSHDAWKLNKPNNLALGAHQSEVVFRSLRLKMLDGKATVDKMMRVEKQAAPPVLAPVPPAGDEVFDSF
jgi:hypothetical protein